MVELENDKPTVVALREIAEGLITPDLLDEEELPPELEMSPPAPDALPPAIPMDLGD